MTKFRHRDRWSCSDHVGMIPLLLACAVLILGLPVPKIAASESVAARIATVVQTPDLVAFWDFAGREEAGQRRFIAHVPPGSSTDYPLDAGNYVHDLWGLGREATYADFPLLGRGPFGEAIRIRRETDPNFRPFLAIPRNRLEDTPLDIKGPGKAVSVVVWAIRESGNHALAGIWHEGTDLKQPQTEGIRKVEVGQRQYGLFAGLEHQGAACGHVSESGGSSFGDKYAWHKSYSHGVSPMVAADAPPTVLDKSWHCFAMTFDPATKELTSWLDGQAGEIWEEDVRRKAAPVYRAWRQGHPPVGTAVTADAEFAPPEDTPVSVKVLADKTDERRELREYRYTRVQVTLRRNPQGEFVPVDRDLVALRVNPWYFPHPIYRPAAGIGGPFTIGRVIHSARSVGFTGWIGGVAVFARALSAQELANLSALAR